MQREQKEKKWYIYVMTNISFPKKWVKIGCTSNLEQRRRGLSSPSQTGLPYPYSIYCYYELPPGDARGKDRWFHDLIIKLNPGVRLEPNKEFFEIDAEDVFDILVDIAQLDNRVEYVHKCDVFGEYCIPPHTENYRLLRKIYSLIIEEIDYKIELSQYRDYVELSRSNYPMFRIRPINNHELEIELLNCKWDILLWNEADNHTPVYRPSRNGVKYEIKSYAISINSTSDLQYAKMIIQDVYDNSIHKIIKF